MTTLNISSNIKEVTRALDGVAKDQIPFATAVNTNWRKDRPLTQEFLKELLSYDISTGVFTWNVNSRGQAHVGDRAGYFCKSQGCYRIGIGGKSYSLHKLAWLYVHGIWPTRELRHENGNRQDNRIENLKDGADKEDGKESNGTKVCSQCGKCKPVFEFSRNSSNKSGYRSNCKECGVIAGRETYKRDREMLVEKRRTYYKTQKEKAVGSVRAYKAKARDELTDYYIKHILSDGGRSPVKEFPQSLIEAKRKQVAILRFINERKDK